MEQALELVAQEEAPKRKTKALSAVETRPAPATAADQAMLMVERIMTDPNIPLDRINHAFDFYKKVQGDQARRAFEAAMARAKPKFKPVVKRKPVFHGEGKAKFKHEDLHDLLAATEPALNSEGMHVRYRISNAPNEPIAVTCILSHEAGHIEETTLRAGADASGAKNSIQAIGSTITYLQRYTYKAALGLAASSDDDGRTADQIADEVVTQEQAEALIELADSKGIDRAKVCSVYKVETLYQLPAKKFQEVRQRLISARAS